MSQQRQGKAIGLEESAKAYFQQVGINPEEKPSPPEPRKMSCHFEWGVCGRYYTYFKLETKEPNQSVLQFEGHLRGDVGYGKALSGNLEFLDEHKDVLMKAQNFSLYIDAQRNAFVTWVHGDAESTQPVSGARPGNYRGTGKWIERKP
jgi:hypothetical protein